LSGMVTKGAAKQTGTPEAYGLAGQERLLTPSELARFLSVRPGTIYSWISRGVDIPYVKIEGTVRFREEAIQAWLLEKEREQKRRNFEL